MCSLIADSVGDNGIVWSGGCSERLTLPLMLAAHSQSNQRPCKYTQHEIVPLRE